MPNYFLNLKDLLNKAYAPYSNFHVAAIVIPKNNSKIYFNGVNIENASFGATICAERSAVCSMVSSGYKQIREIHLLTSSSENTVYPCGICRQFLSEFVDETTKFYIYNLKDECTIKSFSEIMPHQIFKNKEIK